jgi:hypothetical protein
MLNNKNDKRIRENIWIKILKSGTGEANIAGYSKI